MATFDSTNQEADQVKRKQMVALNKEDSQFWRIKKFVSFTAVLNIAEIWSLLTVRVQGGLNSTCGSQSCSQIVLKPSAALPALYWPNGPHRLFVKEENRALINFTVGVIFSYC